MVCPNCESLMDEGESCPECNHDDGDAACDCQHCTNTEFGGEG